MKTIKKTETNLLDCVVLVNCPEVIDRWCLCFGDKSEINYEQFCWTKTLFSMQQQNGGDMMAIQIVPLPIFHNVSAATDCNCNVNRLCTVCTLTSLTGTSFNKSKFFFLLSSLSSWILLSFTTSQNILGFRFERS